MRLLYIFRVNMSFTFENHDFVLCLLALEYFECGKIAGLPSHKVSNVVQ